MHGQNNDDTNFWALSTRVLKRSLELIGFTDAQEVRKVIPPNRGLEKYLARIIVVARRLHLGYGPGGAHTQRSMQQQLDSSLID